MQEPRLIPVSAVAEVLYCPRNFYYRMVEHAQDANHHLIEGQMQEELRESRSSQRRGDLYQTRKVQIESKQYGLIGILDIMEEKDGRKYPVEYKKGQLRHNVNDDVQVCCQALLMEEYLGIDIPAGYIFYMESAKRRVVPLSPELRELTKQTIEEARTILAENIIPEPVNDQRCKGCSLINRCMPEETVFLTRKSAKPKRVMPSANLGRVLYVDTPSVYLRKRQGCISVTKENETITEVPITSVDQLIIIGQVNATTPLLDELLRRGIPTYFCTSNGKLSGWLQPSWNKNSILRIAQIRTHDKEEFKLAVAKKFVQGKLHNERTLLMRYNRTLKNDEILHSCETIAKYIKKIETQPGINELLGIEGIGSRAYFDAVPYLIKHQQEFFFAGRNRRPPRDPINALLSFGYTILTSDIVSEIMRVGLDPYIGYLHSTVYGRPALALDIMEEFRPIIVDSAVFTAINTGMISIDDFEVSEFSCTIKEAGRKAFFQAYRNRMNEEIVHPLFGYKLSYRRTIELQVRLLAKVIQEEFDKYIPFMVR